MSYAPLNAVLAYYRKYGAITGNEFEPLAEHDETDYVQGDRSTA